MSKDKPVFICLNCDSQYPKWQGQCSECGKWGTIKASEAEAGLTSAISLAADISPAQRLRINLPEIEAVLGGGLVPGSLLLLAGDPGIGKSTLVLQMAAAFSRGSAKDVFYVCGEESPEQISLRLGRLGLQIGKLSFLPETNVKNILATAAKSLPGLLIVDSIQTMFAPDVEGEAGNINQVRSATNQFLQLAKSKNIPVLIIGHVTKEGVVAGPRLLEHMVDVVLYLEGDKFQQYRLLRSVKNRFGPTDAVGVFQMTESGLQEVKNPSLLFLNQNREPSPGSAVSVIMEGSRPFLMEIQALTNKTSYGYPKRTASGFDLNRLELLLAVLERRAGLKLGNQDVFLNIAGGLRARDPALDLAAALAVASSLANLPLPPNSIFLGEVGLGGEIRPIAHFEARLNEASRLGFKQFYVPVESDKKNSGVDIKVVKNIKEALNTLIGR